MAPVVRALQAESGIRCLVCTTGQHRSMLAQVMQHFGIAADVELDVMQPEQSLNGLSARLFSAIDGALERLRPDRVLVHGDTTTAMVAAMAAFQRRIPVGHVEAGLRTGDLARPFPEEMNRRVIDSFADLLFAPTATARDHLEQEALAGTIHVTGNTVIDALQLTAARLDGDAALRRGLDDALPALDQAARAGRRLLLVTGHRRENFGEGFDSICDALAELALGRDDIEIVYPVHLNPQVRAPVRARLQGLPRLHLIEPLGYVAFVRLMQRAHAVLTDSGGVQEEAPSLGKPVLVMRDVTERPEAVHAGTVRLVGTRAAAIVGAVEELWCDAPHATGRAASTPAPRNPYGDGHASARIAAVLCGRPYLPFAPAATAQPPVPQPVALRRDTGPMPLPA